MGSASVRMVREVRFPKYEYGKVTLQIIMQRADGVNGVGIISQINPDDFGRVWFIQMTGCPKFDDVFMTVGSFLWAYIHDYTSDHKPDDHRIFIEHMGRIYRRIHDGYDALMIALDD